MLDLARRLGLRFTDIGSTPEVLILGASLQQRRPVSITGPDGGHDALVSM